ncbi:ABC transporter substrate-binding protein [Ferrovibrio sp. MS7]|jgi:branched-chain amino acid transport system substrate-binding protein|uniref:ABC transporter substrate-binding protein n=1 Tax=Ferrovibrio plantarum TaxID=3119164 RepID=UPI0031346833
MSKALSLSAAGIAALSMWMSAADVRAETVRIGAVQGLSGAPAIVDFGESYLQGNEMALKEYNAANPKHKIEFIVYNDEANPQRAVSLVQRLIANDKVSAVIGTVNSGNVAAFAPMLQQAKIPLMAGPAIATDITAKFIDQSPSFIYRCSMVEKFQIDAMLDWGVKSFKKVGLLHGTNGYGMFAAGEVQKGMKERGMELVAVESGAPNVTDLTPQMLKLKNAGAELVLLFHDSLELVYRSMPKIDYKPVIAGNWGLSSQMVLNIVGKEAIEGTVMGQALDLADPKAQAFDTKMKAEYGDKYRWPVVAALGYDGMKLLLQAVDKAGADPLKLQKALEDINDFKAVSGTPAKPFGAKDHECLDAENVFLGVWRNGRVVKLK